MKIKLFLFVSFFCLSLTNDSRAQVVNAYAKVTAISGNELTLSNINETNHTFNVGEEVVIMQMQDNVIDGTTDASTFGTLGSIGSAGLYEVKTISAKTATTITLDSAPSNTYNTGTNSSVQVISFRLFGSPDYTTTADIAALDWDGNVGGIVAIRVAGTLTLNHNITANGAGFRGGVRSNNQGTVDCNTVWRTNSNTVAGEKGEGIYKRTDANYQYGRAKVLNGGGGGNRHNAGGGGGGNFTAGGEGGPGYNCSGSPVGGQGGLSLNSEISISRIFMGGGGGGGQQNNTVGSAGGDGGGIILISAVRVITTGACASRTISASGLNASNSGNDGSGGGGAGGSIIFEVNNFSILPGCPVITTANGGNGGTTNNGSAHGGGGGGGQGRIIFSGATPTNVTVSTNNGTAGCNNNSNPCSNQAGSPGGSNNTGISDNVGDSPLPVSLVYFAGVYREESRSIELKWTTASELNNDYFSLERSTDGVKFELLTTLKGKGTTPATNRYRFEDVDVARNVYYYRLSQTDFDGTTEFLRVIRVDKNVYTTNVWVYPNPVHKEEFLTVDLDGFESGEYSISIFGKSGAQLIQDRFTIEKDFYSLRINVKNLETGIYTLKLVSSTTIYYRRIIIY